MKKIGMKKIGMKKIGGLSGKLDGRGFRHI
jgi:hypothetical protein